MSSSYFLYINDINYLSKFNIKLYPFLYLVLNIHSMA